MKIFDSFLIFSQNIDCGYMSRYIYPCTPQVYYIKVGFKGLNISRTCYLDENVRKNNGFVRFMYQFFFLQ